MTIREIASIAGVSPATISLVLNNKKGISEETRRHVRRIIDEYSYSPPRLKRVARCRIIFIKYRTHGMAVEENQGFIASIIDQIESECRHFSYDLSMCNCSAQTVRDIFRDIAESKPDGIIFLGTELTPDYYHLLDEIDVPLVVLDNRMQNKFIDSVVMDNLSIASDAVHYLHSLGHRSIGFWQSSANISNLKDRHAGYQMAMESLGLTPQKPVMLTPTLSGAYTDMKELLQSGCFDPRGAFFAANDTVAIGAIKALVEGNISIPRQLSVIGVDDIPYSSVTMPPLTTIRLSRSTLGTLAVDLIRKRIRNPQWPAVHIAVSGRLIARGSTAPV